MPSQLGFGCFAYNTSCRLCLIQPAFAAAFLLPVVLNAILMALTDRLDPQDSHVMK